MHRGVLTALEPSLLSVWDVPLTKQHPEGEHCPCCQARAAAWALLGWACGAAGSLRLLQSSSCLPRIHSQHGLQTNYSIHGVSQHFLLLRKFCDFFLIQSFHLENIF